MAKKNNAYKKNTLGTFARDFWDKKTYVKTINRKVRYAGKKACKENA